MKNSQANNLPVKYIFLFKKKNFNWITKLVGIFTVWFYTSFVLQSRETSFVLYIICPIHYLSYTVFVLYSICPTYHKIYTSISVTLHLSWTGEYIYYILQVYQGYNLLEVEFSLFSICSNWRERALSRSYLSFTAICPLLPCLESLGSAPSCLSSTHFWWARPSSRLNPSMVFRGQQYWVGG